MGEVLFNIGMAAAVTAIFKMLVPEGQSVKQVKILLSCFFIVSVMNIFDKQTLTGELSDIFSIDTFYENFDYEFEEQVAREAALSLAGRIEEQLLKENIKPEKIYVDVNISENSSISFNEIRLVLGGAAAETAERAVEITEKYVGYEIKVSLEEAPNERNF